MGLCDETKANIKRIHKKLPAPSKMAFPSPRIYDHDVCCDMCNKLVYYIEVLLEDETVDSQIISLTENLCETFSSPYNSLCKSIFYQNIPLIISYLEQGIQSADICTSI